MNFLTLSLIVSFVLGYTELGTAQSSIKVILQILIILFTVSKVDYKKYVWSVWLLIIIVILPFALILIGVYDFSQLQVISYSIFFMFNYVFTICIADFYSRNITEYIEIWQLALTLVLAFLWIIFGGISLNLGQYLNSMINNNRSNELGIGRVSMGFTNVNQLGMVSAILVVCCIYQIVKKKHCVLTSLLMIAGLILILNSGSRTPIISIGFATFIFLTRFFKNKFFRNILGFAGFFLFLAFSLLFVYLLIKGDTLASTFQAIDKLSSYRLTYGVQAMTVLRGIASVWSGLGPMKSSFINGNLYSGSLDDSFEFYIFTIGYVGTAFVYLFVLFIFMHLFQHKSRYAFLFISFYIVYSVFEHVLFAPNSIVSFFCLTTIFIFMKKTYDKPSELREINGVK